MKNEYTKESALMLTKKYLDDNNVFELTTNKYIEILSNMIGNNISPHMAKGFAIFAMSTFANNMRYKINYSEKNLVPVNVIVFMLSRSGSGKTSSERILRRAFDEGYRALEIEMTKERREYNKRHDIADGIGNLPFFSKIGTGPGTIKRINAFQKFNLGVPSIIIDEIANEFENSPIVSENIQISAETFDSGNLDDKPLKDSTNQSDPIVGMAINTLMMGSESSMLVDSDSTKKLISEFESKLSRRCLFIYPIDVKKDDDYDWNTLLAEIKDEDEKPNKMIREMNKFSLALFNARQVDDNGVTKPLQLLGKVREVYLFYKRYCVEYANSIRPKGIISREEEIINIELQNRHWKTLKIAGVFTVFRGSLEISLQDLREAISFVNMTDGYLNSFLNRTNELPFEKLELYIREYNELPSIDKLVKSGWINNINDMDNLMALTNAKINDIGQIVITGKSYSFKPLPTNKVSISFVKTKLDDDELQRMKKLRDNAISAIGTTNQNQIVSNYINSDTKVIKDISKVNVDELPHLIDKKFNTDKKRVRAKKVAKMGFKFDEVDFDKISKMLTRDASYSSFEFKNGVRNESNCLGKTNLLVLDIDDSEESMQEVSNNLQEFKHIAVSSSDVKNIFKFRLIIKLSKVIDVTGDEYKAIIKAFEVEYNLILDKLPRAQLFHAYNGSKIIENFDNADDFDVDTLMSNYNEYHNEATQIKHESSDILWRNRDDIFKSFYRRKDTEGRNIHKVNISLYHYAREKGGDKQLVRMLVEEHAERFNLRDSHVAYMINRIAQDDDIPLSIEGAIE